MNLAENNSLSYFYLRTTIKHQWGKGLTFLLASTTLIGAATVFWGNTYRSDARIFIRLGRESVSMDPTVSTNGAFSVSDTREIEINSLLEIFHSRGLAERVVDKLGVSTILEGQFQSSNAAEIKPSALSKLISQIRIYKNGREVSRRERAITGLLRELKVWSPKKTTVIGIEYGCGSPEVAQMVVNEVIDAFQTEHARVNRTKGSYEFLQEQSQLFEKELLEAQGAMRDAKNEIGLVSIEGHRQLLLDELTLLETQLIKASSELSGSRARLMSLEKATTELPERRVTEGVIVANDATSRMRELLYEVQILGSDLATKYTEEHPAFKRLQEKSRQVEAIFDAQASDREQTTTGINPARQQLEIVALTEHANQKSLQARCASLNEQRDAVTSRLMSLNADEVRLARLQRALEQAEANFRDYTERKGMARLEQQLEDERISNVNIIQPASFIEKPASPNRLALLVLGLAFASCGSIGVMILAEFDFPALGTDNSRADQESRAIFGQSGA